MEDETIGVFLCVFEKVLILQNSVVSLSVKDSIPVSVNTPLQYLIIYYNWKHVYLIRTFNLIW